MVKAYILSGRNAGSEVESLRWIFREAFVNDRRFLNERDLQKIKSGFDVIVFYNLGFSQAIPLLKQLREKVALPVFFLSHDKEPDLILAAYKLGAKDFFVAPFDVREINEKIKDFVPGFAFKESKAELARKYIDVNFSSPIRLVDIARSVRCTPEHLTRIFRARFELTPHAYLKRVRLEKTREYLTSTNYPLSEICKFTGFYSVAHLCREFKRHTNMTPFTYRQKHLKFT